MNAISDLELNGALRVAIPTEALAAGLPITRSAGRELRWRPGSLFEPLGFTLRRR